MKFGFEMDAPMTQSTNFVLALESLLVFLCKFESTIDNANQ